METRDDITLYRFRVRTADGREAVTRIVATRRVPKARLAGEKEAKEFAEGRLPKSEEDSTPEPMLANPRWSDATFAHGDHADMMVEAPGLDGRTIRFHVEHKHGEGEWTEYDTVEAKVENGVAEARLKLHHPAPGEAEASPADLRFACELV